MIFWQNVKKFSHYKANIRARARIRAIFTFILLYDKKLRKS